MKTIEQLADEYVGHPEEIDEFSSATIKRQAFIDGARAQRSIKEKNEYPKTYEECCRIVNANPYIRLMYDLSDGQKYSYDADNLWLYESIRKLLICRDTYWKIAGEEMGLGKPWKPEWEEEGLYVIINHRGNVVTDIQWYRNVILAFPTKEIRDAFYENFKSEIEICKKFL